MTDESVAGANSTEFVYKRRMKVNDWGSSVIETSHMRSACIVHLPGMTLSLSKSLSFGLLLFVYIL